MENGKRLLFIDSGYSGIAGDLCISSLSGIVGKNIMEEYLQTLVKSIERAKNFHISLENRNNRGFMGTYLNIKQHPPHHHDEHEHEHEHKHEHKHEHEHEHEHDQLNTHLDHDHHSKHSISIENMKKDLGMALNLGKVSILTKKCAFDALDIIIKAESKVHGIPIDKVHLHEIGSIDTIIDIAGTYFALDKLNILKSKTILFSPLAVGGGKIKTAHGIMSVPAPATAEILNSYNIPFKYGPEDYELTTPTGASIIASLIANDIAMPIEPQNLPSLILEEKGTGVGTLELKHQPNILQTKLFRENVIKEEKPYLKQFKNNMHSVYVLETNVDDVRGEFLGEMINSLVNLGALDVSIHPTITKKNRPGHLISVVCNENKFSVLIENIFRHTGSLGVRISQKDRICLNREIIRYKITLENQQFEYGIKISHINTNNDKNSNDFDILHEKIEFDDLKRIADTLNKTPKEIEELIIKTKN